MNMEQLECFLAIIEFRTFSEAAEQLNLSQSALSKKIISLEDELGAKLFSREKRQVALTPLGQSILEDAKKIISLSQKIQNTASSFSENEGNHISITTIPFLNQYGLLEKLEIFQQNHPEIIVNISESEEPTIKKEIAENKLSLTIVRQDFIKSISEDFEYKTIAEDEFVLLVSTQHPFVNKKFVLFDEIKHENFILMNSYTNVYTTFMERCHTHQFTPNIIQTARLETIIGSVAFGHGISFLPLKSIELFQHPKTTVCHFTQKETSQIVLAKRKGKLTKNELIFWKEFPSI